MRTWWDILSLYEVLLVWPLAALVGFALLRAKSRRRQVALSVVLCLLFLPYIHRYIGDLYFDHLCKTQAGEFIYRTVDNVEGILQMRPRDGSKDYFDRMRDGDIPEDPWGHTNVEAQMPWGLIGRYRFIETVDLEVKKDSLRIPTYHPSMSAQAGPADRVARYFGYDGRELHSFRKEFSNKPMSIYGFSWRESRGIVDRLLNVFPGEVTVHQLGSGETLALSRGYLRARPLSACPGGKDDVFVRSFLEKVLRPAVSTYLKAG